LTPGQGLTHNYYGIKLSQCGYTLSGDKSQIRSPAGLLAFEISSRV